MYDSCSFYLLQSLICFRCGIFAMFSTREQTMFFPESHAARAVGVRAKHKFIKEDDSQSGSWERFDNPVTDFQPRKVRQVFFRTGTVNYKYMGAYRCVSQYEMNLDHVPNFPEFVRFSFRWQLSLSDGKHRTPTTSCETRSSNMSRSRRLSRLR